MALYKLQLDEFDEIDYNLIAIHSTMEDFRMAYFLNQKLALSLGKSKDVVEIKTKEGDAFFYKFVFDDLENDILWNLIPNKNEIVIKKEEINHNLFLNTIEEIAIKVYLLPELKKVDYFLKIENNDGTFETEQIIKKIKSINRVASVYDVIPETIKSKNNLIF